MPQEVFIYYIYKIHSELYVEIKPSRGVCVNIFISLIREVWALCKGFSLNAFKIFTNFVYPSSTLIDIYI